MRYLALVILLGTAAMAVGQVPGNPAGPRLGTIYELSVRWSGPDMLERLADGGYNVDHVQPEIGAVVYATPEEREQLAASGFSFDVIGEQPREWPKAVGPKALGTYSTYASLSTDLQNYAAAHPAIARLYTLGQSVQGREIWALLISDNPDVEEAEPEFKYVSTMHGDEPVGTEMCLYLIDRLLNDYGSDMRITTLVDETAIWIVPLMNPDGLTAGTRNNANGFDLNRAFPEYGLHFTGTLYDGEPLGGTGRPPEVRRIMEWSAVNSFVLSANLHTGALVVNYPYDHDLGIPSGTDAPSPDDLLFEDVSLRYSSNNPPMFASFTFPNGITNGSDWFSITGGMQDWNYRYLGCNEVTLELSVTKTPPQGDLPALWADNEESMLQYLEAVHTGVRGIVTAQSGGQPLYAKVTIQGNPQRVFTDPHVGDYYRMLLPGTHTMVIEAHGFYPKTMEVTVGAGAATVMDLQLEAIGLGMGAWALAAIAAVLGLVAVAFVVRRARV